MNNGLSLTGGVRFPLGSLGLCSVKNREALLVQLSGILLATVRPKEAREDRVELLSVLLVALKKIKIIR